MTYNVSSGTLSLYTTTNTDSQGTNGVETLPKISIASVGRTNVTDDRRTDGR